MSKWKQVKEAYEKVNHLKKEVVNSNRKLNRASRKVKGLIKSLPKKDKEFYRDHIKSIISYLL